MFIALASVSCNAEQKIGNSGLDSRIVDDAENKNLFEERVERSLRSSKTESTMKSVKTKSKATKQPKESKAGKSAKGAKTQPPTESPTMVGTQTTSPTSTASLLPSGVPSAAPTGAPTQPTSAPTGTPTRPTSAPTGAPIQPTSVPTMAPSTTPTSDVSAVPTTPPSSLPTTSPTDSPTTTMSPTNVPTMAPSTSAVPTTPPSSLPTTSPTTDSPTISPTSSPSVTPSTTGPSSAPTAFQCTHDSTSNPIHFVPIKGDDGAENPNFYYNEDYYDDYGYTDDADDNTADTLEQIPNIDDFRLEENGRMSFIYPWGCTPVGTPDCQKATLEIFEENSSNPLRGDENVFVKEVATDDSLIVSWERVIGKNGDGDVNVQAQLFPDGDIRVCFGCGSLPAGLSMTMVFDRDDSRPYPDGTPPTNGPIEGVNFGPADNNVYPENQCFTYTPTTSNECIHDTTSDPHFVPIKDDGGVNPDFLYYVGYDDYGYTDDADDNNLGTGVDDYYRTFEQIPNIDDFRLEENGRMSFIYPWGCTPVGTPDCQKATLEIFEENSSNPLRGDENVFVKEVATDDSLIVSWERVIGKNGDGDVNVQAQLFPDGDIRVCFGCGSLPAGLSMTMVFDRDDSRPYPIDDDIPPTNGPIEGVNFGPADNNVYPENQCFTV